MTPSVVLALARVELRRTWRSLLVLGLLAGLTGALALAGVATARRTTTVHDRLLEAIALDDARVLLMGRPQAGERIAELPGVEAAWTATATVGQVRQDAVHYVAVTSGPPKPPDLFTPVLVQGRAPADDAPREVTVAENLAGFVGLRPGSTLPITLLAPEEVLQFDTGFGEPDGPQVDLVVTGIVRVASAGNEGTGPVYAGPAFAERYARWAAGSTALLRLESDPGARARFEEALAALADDPEVAAATAEFGPLRPVYPDVRTEPQVATAERVLGTALRGSAALAALAGVLVTAQGLARLAGAGAAAQRVESALGIVTAERVAARALPAGVTALVAGLLAGAGALLAGHVEPLGSLARLEPAPGWRPDLTVAATGAAAIAAVVLLVAAGASWLAGRPAAPTGQPAPLRLPRPLRDRPVLLVGTQFAVARGRAPAPGGGVPVRTTLAGVVLGVTGVVATATFATSLTAVQDDAATYGWHAHFVVVDAKEPDVARLVADPAVTDVDLVSETTVLVDGASTPAYATEPRKGTLPWTVVSGRLPRGESEVAVGPQLADRLGVAAGDRLPVGPEGAAATVVGVVQLPAVAGERLGSSLLLHPSALDTAAEAQPLLNAFVRGEPGAYDRYATDLELTPAGPPAEVANLADLGRLPAALQAFLVLVAVVALAHALVLTCRRRGRDVGVLRSLGFTPRQVGATVLAMAGTTVGIGVLVGVPLGLALGRLAWNETAAALGLAAGVRLPAAALVVLVPAAAVVAVAVAALPARRAARLSPATALRAE